MMRIRLGLFFVKLGFRVLGEHDVADSIKNRRVDQRGAVSGGDIVGGDLIRISPKDHD